MMKFLAHEVDRDAYFFAAHSPASQMLDASQLLVICQLKGAQTPDRCESGKATKGALCENAGCF
jgi:hypothetical protein